MATDDRARVDLSGLRAKLSPVEDEQKCESEVGMSWPEAFVYAVLVIGSFGLVSFVVYVAHTRPRSTPPQDDPPLYKTTTWTYTGPVEHAPNWAEIIKGNGEEPKAELDDDVLA